MSGKSNVNPNYYKVAGRERQGEDIDHEREKQEAALEAAARRGAPANYIPGAAPAGQPEAAPKPAGPKRTRTALGKEAAKARRRKAA